MSSPSLAHEHLPSLFLGLGVVILLFAIQHIFSIGHGTKRSGDVAEETSQPRRDPFRPKCALGPKDQILLDMLDPSTNNYVITDPKMKDNPIIYASDAFCRFTKYSHDEIEGRNCRFLQGKGTDANDVAEIRRSIDEKRDTNVCLLNYKKTGESFINQFFISPLRSQKDGEVVYFIGVQHQVKEIGVGQQHENEGWVYTMGTRE